MVIRSQIIRPKVARTQVNRNSMQNYITAQGTLLEDFLDASQWTNELNAALTNDTTYTRDTVSLKVVQTGLDSRFYKTINRSGVDLDNITISFYIIDATLFSTLNIFLSSNAMSSKWLLGSINASTTAIRNGWNTVTIPKSSFSTAGGEVWTNVFNRLRIQMQSLSATTIYLDKIIFNQKGSGTVIFCTDDSQRVQDLTTPDTLISLISEFNIPLTLFICKEHYDNIPIGCYSKAVHQQLVNNYGCDAQIHSVTHNGQDSTKYVYSGRTSSQWLDANNAWSWLNMSVDAIKAEIQENLELLYSDGLKIRGTDIHMATPNGVDCENIRQACRDLGIKTLRTVNYGQQSAPFERKYLNTQTNDVMEVATSFLAPTTVLATELARIDRVMASGGCLIFSWHGIYNAPSDGMATYSDLFGIMQYCRNKNVRVQTFSNWYRGLNNYPRDSY